MSSWAVILLSKRPLPKVFIARALGSLPTESVPPPFLILPSDAKGK